MVKITPKQMAQQWQRLPNKFEVNVLNFAVNVGIKAQEVFRQSFYLNRFNSASSPAWPSRTDRRSHPLLRETGALYDSIVWKQQKVAGSRVVRVYTDPKTFSRSNRQYGRKFCYAAIHNEGGEAAGATGFAARIRQRQYIGYSTVLADELLSASAYIFEGFPQ